MYAEATNESKSCQDVDSRLAFSSERTVKSINIFFHRDVYKVRDGTAMYVRRLSRELGRFFQVNLFVYGEAKRVYSVRCNGYTLHVVPRPRIPLLGAFLMLKGNEKLYYSLAAFSPKIYFISKRIAQAEYALCIDAYCAFMIGPLSRIEGKKFVLRPNDCHFSMGLQTFCSFFRVLGILMLFGSIVEKLVSKYAQLILVPSAETASLFERYYGVRSTVYVSPPGSEAENGNHEFSVRREIGMMEDQPLVVFLGTGDNFANQVSIRYILNRLAPFLEKEIPMTKIMIIGDKTERFRRDVKTSNVYVIGGVEEIAPYMEAADLAIAPVEIMGGVSAKIIEYLYRGLPVVATTFAAKTVNQRLGVFRTGMDSFHLAVANIIKTIQDVRILRERIRQEALATFSWKKIGFDVKTLLDSISN